MAGPQGTEGAASTSSEMSTQQLRRIGNFAKQTTLPLIMGSPGSPPPARGPAASFSYSRNGNNGHLSQAPSCQELEDELQSINAYCRDPQSDLEDEEDRSAATHQELNMRRCVSLYGGHRGSGGTTALLLNGTARQEVPPAVGNHNIASGASSPEVTNTSPRRVARQSSNQLWASVLPELVSPDTLRPGGPADIGFLEKRSIDRRGSSQEPPSPGRALPAAPPTRVADAAAASHFMGLPGNLSLNSHLPHRYVRLQPSKELAIVSAQEPETVDAVMALANLMAYRKEFIRDFPERDSVCLRQSHIPNELLGVISTEPQFGLAHVKILPSIIARLEFIDGFFHVFCRPEPLSASAVNGGTPEPSPTLPTGTTENLATQSSPKMEDLPLLWKSNPIPSVRRFLTTLSQTMSTVQDPLCKSFCYRRLRYLREKFSFHLMFNGTAELGEVQANTHRDFYNVRKVDTHVHHSACMQQKQLLRFIRQKYCHSPDEIVKIDENGEHVSLKDLFQRNLGLTAHDLSVDNLNVQALGSCFHRFDIFNTKYNPFGQQELRDLFLKTDNHVDGRYLAEITRDVMTSLEESKYTFVEWRISIYGKARDEWHKLAKWFKTHKLECRQVRWLIQVPRLYAVYKSRGLVDTFGEMLRNIFQPVFEVLIDPASDPDLFTLLHHVVGWDSVDNETISSKFTTDVDYLPLPDEWNSELSPPYSYWAYYMYANIRALNELLSARGMRTMPFRPHCGEAGNQSHLATMFLLAEGINHGIMLKKIPVLHYLYYIKQIPVAVSPLSNNALFHEIERSPFPDFFYIGLNVSLSTDDPLMFHFTDEPLLEEYSCCAHIWRLSPVDLCEIARNSVLQSGFEPMLKRHWIGENYQCSGKAGNDISRTNVADVRLQYRDDTLREELRLLRDTLAGGKLLNYKAPA